MKIFDVVEGVWVDDKKKFESIVPKAATEADKFGTGFGRHDSSNKSLPFKDGYDDT